MKNCFLTGLICFILSATACAQQIRWTRIAPGIWKGVAGKPENYDLLKAAGSSPNIEGLTKIGEAIFPVSKNDIVASIGISAPVTRFAKEQYPAYAKEVLRVAGAIGKLLSNAEEKST